MQVTTIAADDGTTSVFIGGGQRLVLGSEASPLAAVADVFDPSRVQLGMNDSGTIRELPAGLITGGSIAGLLRFQNNDLVDARNQLGQIASGDRRAAVNAQQALGLDLGKPAAAGAPVLFGRRSRAACKRLSTNAGGSAVPSLSPGGRAANCRPSDYELYADPALPAGNYQLTRRSDGVQMTVSDGDVVDGFRIDIGSAPAPAAGDRFLLQPVGAAARNTTRVLDDPARHRRGLAGDGHAGRRQHRHGQRRGPHGDSGDAGRGRADGHPDLHQRHRRLQPGNCATPAMRSCDRHRHLAGRPDHPQRRLDAGHAGHALRLAARLNGVPRSGDVITVAATALPGGRQRQRARTARRCAMPASSGSAPSAAWCRPATP